MEFDFDIHKTIGSDRVISVWDKRSLGDNRRTNPQWVAEMTTLIGTLGKFSAKAQQLPGPITSFTKLVNSDHRLYLYVDNKQAVGMLKVGTKKLFIRTNQGNYHEIEPLCVLDFYVHESAQRSGIGKLLYEVMLETEHAVPHKMGYDRPSPKLLGFLRKHYNLTKYVPQANNFVVYNDYFDHPAEENPRSARAADGDAKSYEPAPPPPPPPSHLTSYTANFSNSTQNCRSNVYGSVSDQSPGLKRPSLRHQQQHALPPLARPF